ncbi:MAG: hypothetical protein LBK13_00740, partial [Spirochaetales bacterium]|nr:hypothetical protein [Spirochaetales bacterium]
MDGIQIRVYCPECGAEVGMVLGRERIPEQLIRMFKIFNLPDPGGENAYKGETGCSCGKIVKATFVIEAFPEGERTK